jgi:Clathrin light chain
MQMACYNRAWKESFEQTVQERDIKSKHKKEETLANAKNALERFYAEYNDKKQKTIARNKEMEKKVVNESLAASGSDPNANIWVFFWSCTTL